MSHEQRGAEQARSDRDRFERQPPNPVASADLVRWLGPVPTISVVGYGDRRGAGRLLLNTARDLAQAAGCYKIRLLSAGGPEVHGFYLANDHRPLAQGFRHTSTPPRDPNAHGPAARLDIMTRVPMWSPGDVVELDGLLAVVVRVEGVPDDHVALWFGTPQGTRLSQGGPGRSRAEVHTVPTELVRSAVPPIVIH